MAAPKFTPLDPTDRPRTYSSPEHVPSPWRNDKPAAIVARQPKGQKLGYQGPDQGYALKLAEGLRDSIVLQPGESAMMQFVEQSPSLCVVPRDLGEHR